MNEIKDLKKAKINTWYKYTGSLITMRDSSQMKIMEIYKKEKTIPIDLKNKVIFYGAPAESKKITIGPTTSIRMDTFLPFLIEQGIIATVGKGPRSKDAISLIKKHQTPYFIIPSGVSAYLSQFFIEQKIIALHELGPEAIREYKVKNLPILTAIDINGNTIF